MWKKSRMTVSWSVGCKRFKPSCLSISSQSRSLSIAHEAEMEGNRVMFLRDCDGGLLERMEQKEPVDAAGRI